MLAIVQKKLSAISCPSCQSPKAMNAVLRCDLGLDACLVAIQCNNCMTQFELSAPTDHKELDRCPECREQESAARVLCDLSSLRFHMIPEPCSDCRSGVKREHLAKAA